MLHTQGAPRLLVGMLLSLGAWGCATSTDDEVTHDRCEQVRDHLVDLRIAHADHLPMIETPPQPTVGRPVGSVVDVPLDVAQHRVALRRALGERFIANCQKTMSATEVRCVLAAADQSSASSCSPKSSPRPHSQPPASRTASM